ncbi:MAG: hypothetical protein AAGA23_00235 [Pseudomonadota bacterium]
MIARPFYASPVAFFRTGLLGATLTAGLTFGGNVHALITVGSDAACDFNNLQAAVDSIPRGESDVIRLANNLNAEPVQVVGVSIDVIGGYTSCTDSTSNANDRSIIRGFGGVQPVVFASGFTNAEPQYLRLTSVIVEDGSAEFGSGIRVGARYAANLSNVIVRDNVSQDSGGGIYLDGSNGATLRLEYGTRVEDNHAGKYGGGIFCRNGQIDFRDGAIDSNLAGAHGGGVHLDNCELTGSFSGARSISHNRVDYHTAGLDGDDLLGGLLLAAGGGLFVINSSTVVLGSESSSTVIEHNQVRDGYYDGGGFANYNIYGYGGGLAARGGATAISLTNTHVGHNTGMHGGGAYLFDGAHLSVQRDPEGCQTVAGYVGCASFDDNLAEGYSQGFTGCVATAATFAGQGGALAALSGASARFDGVTIRDNTVTRYKSCVFVNDKYRPEGAAIYQSSSHVELLNSLVHRNVGAGEDAPDDIIHLAGSSPSLKVVHSHIVGNDSDVEATIRTSAASPRFQIFSSIILTTGSRGFGTASASDVEVTVDCLYASNTAPFSDQPGLAFNLMDGSNPGFVNGSAGDFRLAAGSDAVDFCDAGAIAAAGLSSGIQKDLDGNDRPILVTQPATAYDLGAFEYQSGIAAQVVDLGVTIDDGGLNYAPNSTMGYTVTLRNEGPEAISDAAFRLELDNVIGNRSVIPFSGDWSCLENGQLLTCSYEANLIAGQTAPAVAVQFAAPDYPAQLRSTVKTVASNTVVDPVDSNNEATEVTSISQEADLAVSVIAAPEVVTPGTRPVYRFGLENLGPDTASQPRITFTFPGVAIEPRVDVAPTGFTCGEVVELPNETLTVSCERTTLAVVQQEFDVSARLPTDYSDLSWDISARAQSASGDADTANDEALASSELGFLGADLSLSGVAPEYLQPTTINQFAITLENLGPGLAQAPVITGAFSGGAADPLIVSGAGFICVPVGAEPYEGFECLANADLPVSEPADLTVALIPVDVAASLTVEVTVVSGTEDPEIGAGSNNELLLIAPLGSGPIAGGDVLFSDSFEEPPAPGAAASP